jgi:hypothetical protein
MAVLKTSIDSSEPFLVLPCKLNVKHKLKYFPCDIYIMTSVYLFFKNQHIMALEMFMIMTGAARKFGLSV